MAIFLLENRDFLGFRMIFKVALNQIFSKFNVKYIVIEINLYLMVHSSVLKFEKISLSGTLNIIRKPKNIPYNYGVFHIYHSWVMALFLLENRDIFRFPNDI
jgi:hypothetical protein